MAGYYLAARHKHACTLRSIRRVAEPVGGEGDEAVAEGTLGTDCSERDGPEPCPSHLALRLQKGPVSTATASRGMPLHLPSRAFRRMRSF